MENQLQNIPNKIHTIRGENIMLDFDLAELYEIETKMLNRAVKRNIRRFPAKTITAAGGSCFNLLILNGKVCGSNLAPHTLKSDLKHIFLMLLPNQALPS